MSQKIFLITKNYPPQIGGIERYSSDLFLKLKSEGHQVCIVKAWPRNERLLSLISMHSGFLKSILKITYLFTELRRLSSFMIRTCTLGLYYSYKSDVIWSLDGSISFLSYFLSILTCKKTKITFHAKDVIWNNAIYQFVMPFFWKRADNAICVSKIMEKELIKRGVDVCKILVQENVVENLIFHWTGSFDKEVFLKYYGLPLDKILLFSIWRFVEKKGFHWFLSEVMPFLNIQKFHYVLVGAWCMAWVYKSIIDQKLLKNVTLLGPIIDPVEKARFFTVADYIIIPNIFVVWDREWSPIVLSEAKYYKLPCILADIDGLSSYAWSHILLKPQDSSSWIHRIQEL